MGIDRQDRYSRIVLWLNVVPRIHLPVDTHSLHTCFMWVFGQQFCVLLCTLYCNRCYFTNSFKILPSSDIVQDEYSFSLLDLTQYFLSSIANFCHNHQISLGYELDLLITSKINYINFYWFRILRMRLSSTWHGWKLDRDWEKRPGSERVELRSSPPFTIIETKIQIRFTCFFNDFRAILSSPTYPNLTPNDNPHRLIGQTVANNADNGSYPESSSIYLRCHQSTSSDVTGCHQSNDQGGSWSTSGVINWPPVYP